MPADRERETVTATQVAVTASAAREPGSQARYFPAESIKDLGETQFRLRRQINNAHTSQ